VLFVLSAIKQTLLEQICYFAVPRVACTLFDVAEHLKDRDVSQVSFLTVFLAKSENLST
jgi:hypothetical protein